MYDINIMTSRGRYQIQNLNAEGQWEETRTRSNYPETLVRRIENRFNPQDSRVWDTQTDTIYVAPPLYVETDEQKAERAVRWAASKLADEKYWAEKDAENKKLLEKYQRETKEARESLNEKVLSTTEDFDNLTDNEKSLLVSEISDAHHDTNIDGYGDEGAGYDMDRFAANLIKLGWEYHPKKKN